LWRGSDHQKKNTSFTKENLSMWQQNTDEKTKNKNNTVPVCIFDVYIALADGTMLQATSLSGWQTRTILCYLCYGSKLKTVSNGLQK